MLPVEDARKRILEGFAPLGAEQISVADALGRVLAEDVIARVTKPPMAVSAMDGYAVRAGDVQKTPVRLRQVGYVQAGKSHDREVGAGECVRIFTGGPMPTGTDTIVVQENVDASGEWITVKENTPERRYVRPAGLDFKEGEPGIKAGRRLTARDVGLIGVMNVPWIMVHRRPRVAILSSGDEIVMPGDPIGRNQFVSANGLALAALVSATGGLPYSLGIAADTPEAVQAAGNAATGADLLVTTGGASVGEHDLIRSALAKTGLDIDFWQIAVRPGKPLMFGRMGGTRVIGLPGNPVSAMVCAILFLRPAVEAMQGIPFVQKPPVMATLGVDLPANDKREDYLRSELKREADGRLVAVPFPVQDSSMITRLARADCLVIRAPHAPPLKAGNLVEILPFDGHLANI